VVLPNAFSFVGVIAMLYGWRRRKPDDRLPSAPVLNSIRAGIRYARHAPALRALLVRTVLFVPFASALWALLPVLARHEMGFDSVQYGILFGCLGAGAVVDAIVLPELQRRFCKDMLSGAFVRRRGIDLGACGHSALTLERRRGVGLGALGSLA